MFARRSARRSVRAHSRHDDGEAGQIAPRQIVGDDHLDSRSELLDCLGHLVADTHDIAHAKVWRDAHLEGFDDPGRRLEEVTPLDVRILDRLETGGRLAVDCHAYPVVIGFHTSGRADGEAYRPGFVLTRE